MKTTAKLALALGAFAMMSYAESWTGKLIDSSCHDRSQQNPAEAKKGADASCDASASTTSFAIQTSDGKVYKLDASGNAKASTALRGNADNKNPTATVSGTMEGQTVKVDSISVR
jgi:3-deoxy-D-arabino-heptulosonate 7-phosphate (DAHP) synthase